MAEPKTRPTSASVTKFLAAVADETRRADARAICQLLQKASGEKPVMWGTAIVGFGTRELVYPNGRTMDWPVIAFSPRKSNTVLYLFEGYDGYGKLLARLGKHKIGRACLYINKLTDVDLGVLTELVELSVRHAKSA